MFRSGSVVQDKGSFEIAVGPSETKKDGQLSKPSRDGRFSLRVKDAAFPGRLLILATCGRFKRLDKTQNLGETTYQTYKNSKFERDE